MVFLVLSNGFMQNILELLVDVINTLNESGVFVERRLIRVRDCLCGSKKKCNINGSQGGIPDPPEKGYGWWNYGEPCCSYVGHMEYSCPMYGES
jgi:hypothetical protein